MITKTRTDCIHVGECYSYSGWYSGHKVRSYGSPYGVTATGTITSGSGKRRDNYCLHTVDYSGLIPTGDRAEICEILPVAGMPPSSPVNQVVYGGSHSEYCKNWSLHGPVPMVPSEQLASFPNFGEWCQNAVDRWSRATGADLDLPTSLWEIGDVARLRQAGVNLMRCVERIARGPRRIRKLFSRRTLEALVGGELGYAYGLRPLYSDLKALWNGLTGSWQQGYARLLQSIDKPSRVVKAEDGDWSATPVWSGEYGYQQLGSFRYRLRAMRLVTNPSGRAYTYNQYLRTKLGFDRPFYTLWNVLPFSFVVDAFIDVGRAIDRMSKFGDQLQVQLTSVCCSRKLTYETNYSVRPPGGLYRDGWGSVVNNGMYLAPRWVGLSRKRSYERFPHVPTLGSVLPSASSSWRFQLVSLGTLAVGQILRGIPRLQGFVERRMAYSTVRREALSAPHVWD